jgi:hypothetical protein
VEIKRGNHRRYLTLSKGKSQISICVHVPERPTETVSAAAFFLHSLHGCKLGPNDMFPYVADRLSAAGIYCIRFDYVGNGESTWQEDNHIESKADDAVFVIKHICREFGINHISLVSISNSASLAFYLDDTAKKIGSMIFLSPIFIHTKSLHEPGSALYTRLMEYGRKLCHKETYIKFVRGEIDLKAIFTVLRKTRRPSNASMEIGIDRSRLLKATKYIASIPSILVIGSRDPHCKKNLMHYKSFIRKNGFNWDTKVLDGAGHNYTSPADRDRVVGMIYEHICKIVKK